MQSSPRGTAEGIVGFLQQCGIWQPWTDHHTQHVTLPQPYQLYTIRLSDLGLDKKGENTVLIDETNGTIGAAANGRGGVTDTATLAYQSFLFFFQRLAELCGNNYTSPT